MDIDRYYSMRYLGFLISALIANAAGLIGSVFTAQSVRTWYLIINRPSWNPPGWIFGPVWTILYILMGVASYLVWEKRGLPGAKSALFVYGIQLVLNLLWSFLFFGLKNPGLAFAEIILLWLAIVATLVLFWRLNTTAGALLVPYLLWVSFASFLNYTIWKLNS